MFVEEFARFERGTGKGPIKDLVPEYTYEFYNFPVEEFQSFEEPYLKPFKTSQLFSSNGFEKSASLLYGAPFEEKSSDLSHFGSYLPEENFAPSLDLTGIGFSMPSKYVTSIKDNLPFKDLGSLVNYSPAQPFQSHGVSVPAEKGEPFEGIDASKKMPSVSETLAEEVVPVLQTDQSKNGKLVLQSRPSSSKMRKIGRQKKRLRGLSTNLNNGVNPSSGSFRQTQHSGNKNNRYGLQKVSSSNGQTRQEGNKNNKDILQKLTAFNGQTRQEGNKNDLHVVKKLSASEGQIRQEDNKNKKGTLSSTSSGLIRQSKNTNNVETLSTSSTGRHRQSANTNNVGTAPSVVLGRARQYESLKHVEQSQKLSASNGQIRQTGNTNIIGDTGHFLVLKNQDDVSPIKPQAYDVLYRQSKSNKDEVKGASSPPRSKSDKGDEHIKLIIKLANI